MNHEETVRLLRECNSGIKMGVYALNEVLPKVRSAPLADILVHGRQEHERLGNETHAMLRHYNDPDKEPNAMAKGMAKMKTDMKLMVAPGDETVADLITDGCHMGIKSLSRYLNQYPQAEECVRDLTGRLIRLEEEMATGIRPYL